MKNKSLAIFLASAVLCSAAVCAEDAKFVSVKGKVEVQNGTTWTAVKSGDPVSKGQVISTGFKSQAVIQFKGSVFTLAPLTRMTLEQLADTPEKDDTQLFLDTGSVSASVKKTENKRVQFTVRGSVATASVRGTEITTDALGHLSCTEGSTAYWPTPKNQASAQVVEENRAAAQTGTSNAFTAADTVSSLAPTNAIAVSAGQSATFTGQDIVTPAAAANNNASSTAGSTASLSQKEAVSTAPATITSVTEATTAASSGKEVTTAASTTTTTTPAATPTSTVTVTVSM